MNEHDAFPPPTVIPDTPIIPDTPTARSASPDASAGQDEPRRGRSRTTAAATVSGVLAALVTAVALFVTGVGVTATPERAATGAAAPTVSPEWDEPTGPPDVVVNGGSSGEEASRPAEASATPPVSAAAPHTDDTGSPVTTLEDRYRSSVEGFLDGFVAAHERGDVEELYATLHPSIKLAFGEDACMDYIEETVGSITAARVVEVGPPRVHGMDTPHGPISFEQAIPFTVEFLTADGAIVSNPANLPFHDDEIHWLTTCGVSID